MYAGEGGGGGLVFGLSLFELLEWFESFPA